MVLGVICLPSQHNKVGVSKKTIQAFGTVQNAQYILPVRYIVLYYYISIHIPKLESGGFLGNLNTVDWSSNTQDLMCPRICLCLTVDPFTSSKVPSGHRNSLEAVDIQVMKLKKYFFWT